MTQTVNESLLLLQKSPVAILWLLFGSNGNNRILTAFKTCHSHGSSCEKLLLMSNVNLCLLVLWDFGINEQPTKKGFVLWQVT